MNQIPANLNDGTTGHKLQRMSKDVIIVTSWPTGDLSKIFKNWEYVVLSRVCTLSGLYLVDPMDMEKSFNPSSQLRSYIDKIKQKEKDILDEAKKLCHKYHGHKQIVYRKNGSQSTTLSTNHPVKVSKSIYQYLNHHIRRNQYSTWELNGVIALYSRYEQNTTNEPHKYKVLHTIYTPYPYL